MNKGLVLLSGGIDSTVTAWIANGECDELYALTFRYGQTHEKEVACAMQLGGPLGLKEHKILDIPLNQIGGSTLLGGKGSTWVPQRNSIFLAIAYAWAEVLECNRVYVGVNRTDYDEYPDQRPEFINMIERALNFASKGYVDKGKEINLKTPTIEMSKGEIVKLGQELGVPFEFTWSCYRGEELACGTCEACKIRLDAFKEAGILDAISYNIGNICRDCLKGSDYPECPLLVKEQKDCMRGKGVNLKLE